MNPIRNWNSPVSKLYVTSRSVVSLHEPYKELKRVSSKPFVFAIDIFDNYMNPIRNWNLRHQNKLSSYWSLVLHEPYKELKPSLAQSLNARITPRRGFYYMNPIRNWNKTYYNFKRLLINCSWTLHEPYKELKQLQPRVWYLRRTENYMNPIRNWNAARTGWRTDWGAALALHYMNPIKELKPLIAIGTTTRPA